MSLALQERRGCLQPAHWTPPDPAAHLTWTLLEAGKSKAMVQTDSVSGEGHLFDGHLFTVILMPWGIGSLGSLV